MVTDIIYPPRPEFRTTPQTLQRYEDEAFGSRAKQYLAQPKFNGSCTVLITGQDGGYQIRKRDGRELSLIGNAVSWMGLAKAHPDSVFVGEYMNKYKLNEKGEKWVDKFVIFDILRYDGTSFIGQTVRQRICFLTTLFGMNEMYVDRAGRLQTHPYCFVTQFDNVFLIRSYYARFRNVYDELTAIDMIEGLVLKRLEAPLEPAYSEKNNTLWQVKRRKETKNYTH